MSDTQDKKYLIFAATGVGLGHLMGALLDCAFYAHATGRVFAMDMREVIFFGSDSHTAFFENFEVQVPEDLEVVTDLGRIEALKRERDILFVSLETPLIVERPFPNKVVMVPCISPGDPFSPAVRRDDRVFRVNLKAQLAEALARALALPQWRKRVIGLHYRAAVGEMFERISKLTVPDYDERFEVIKDQYVAKAQQLVEGLDPDSYAFMVASDDRSFVNEMKRRLPGAFSIGTLRLDQEFMAYMKANKHDLSILVDAVTDLWALSRCEELIHSRSAFTHFAIMNSVHLDETNTHYIYMPLLDEVLRSLPPAKAVEWAEAAARKIAISRMHFAKTYRYLGGALERAGEMERAAYAHRRAEWHEQASESPEVQNPDIFAERAEQKEGKQNLALVRARRAAASMPGNPYLFGGFGGSLSSLLLWHGDKQGAADAARRAVELDPQDPFLHDHLGYVLWRIGEDADAEPAFRRAIAMSPDVASFHVNHAYCLTRLGRTEEALAAAERAAALDPRNDRACSAAGEAAMANRSFAAAEASFRRASELNTEDPGILHRLSIAIERQGRYDEAAEIARRIAEREPENPEYKRRLGALLGMAGDTTKAEATLREGLARNPGDAKLHQALIETLTAQRRYTEASAVLEQALAAAPGHAGFHRLHGASALAAGKFAEAEAALRRAASLDGADAGTQHLLSIACERLGRLHEAIIAATAASRLDPADRGRSDRVLALARRLATEGAAEVG